jgi:hypothetical protein
MFGFEGLLLTTMLARAGGEPMPIFVPPELARRTSNPEPSGIVWCPPLERYLVVSDDTGHKGEGTNHAPWVLTMTANGRFDAQPLPILGLPRLNDAEALTTGPDGTYFLATSHSPRRSGKDAGADRSLVLHLAAARQGLRVLGRFSLTGAHGDGQAALLTAAGLDPAGRLDIEAIAYHDGALYVGFKSPLASNGAAVIVRVADPVGVARAERLPPGAVSRWAEVELRVDDGGRRVAQGISDMTFLPDGSLALLSNTPKGKEKSGGGGGALWRLKNPGAKGARAELLKHFDHLKPEGVTLAADGKSLVVVLDHDQQQPLWARWPLPAK